MQYLECLLYVFMEDTHIGAFCFLHAPCTDPSLLTWHVNTTTLFLLGPFCVNIFACMPFFIMCVYHLLCVCVCEIEVYSCAFISLMSLPVISSELCVFQSSCVELPHTPSESSGKQDQPVEAAAAPPVLGKPRGVGH